MVDEAIVMGRANVRGDRWTGARIPSSLTAAITRFIGAIPSLARSNRRARHASSGGGTVCDLHNRPETVLTSREARDALGIPTEATLVIGWAGPLDLRSGVLDLIEAVSICDERVAVVIPVVGAEHHRVADQADARELLHRVRFATTAPGQSRPKTTIEVVPAMLAAVDAVIVTSPRRRADRALFREACAIAADHGIPIISLGKAPAGLPQGRAAWTIRAGDAGLLARLLTVIAARPNLLQVAGGAMSAVRHSATPGRHGSLRQDAVRRAPSGP